MSSGIYCRKCHGSFCTKKLYEEHTCDLVRVGKTWIDEFLVCQLDDGCFYARTDLSSVVTPLVASRLAELGNHEILLSRARKVFKDAKIVRVSVRYELEDV